MPPRATRFVRWSDGQSAQPGESIQAEAFLLTRGPLHPSYCYRRGWNASDANFGVACRIQALAARLAASSSVLVEVDEGGWLAATLLVRSAWVSGLRVPEKVGGMSTRAWPPLSADREESIGDLCRNPGGRRRSPGVAAARPNWRPIGPDAIAVRLPAENDTAGWSENPDTVVDATGDRANVILVAASMGGFTAPIVCSRHQVDLLVLLKDDHARRDLQRVGVEQGYRIQRGASSTPASGCRPSRPATTPSSTTTTCRPSSEPRRRRGHKPGAVDDATG